MASRLRMVGTDKYLVVQDEPRELVQKLNGADKWIELTDQAGKTIQVNPAHAYLIEEQTLRTGKAEFI